MISYLLKLLYFLLISSLVIKTYYIDFPFHIENFDEYFMYSVIMFCFYLFYKGYNYITGAEKINFTPIKILNLFLIQLFILSILTFSLNLHSGGEGIILFFRILMYLVLPTILTITFISTGKYINQKIPDFKSETPIFQFLISVGVGFFVFITIVTIFGFLGFYNWQTISGILISLIGISRKEFIQILKGFFTYKIEIDDHKYTNQKQNNIFSNINLYLLSSEFLFIIISLLISTNLINIVRPMPIGWDDLGVYMNYPNLFASAGSILNIGGMFTWQVFTGIGYIFFGATQAFFINNIGGILSVLVIILSLNDLLKNTKKTFINIPVLIGSIFLAMPMVIFQQAKDMKLDPGLMFISTIILYITYYIFLKYMGYKKTEEIEDINVKKLNFKNYFTKFENIGEDIFSKKNYLIYMLIIGILSGLAFSIKFTSLFLISGIIGIIFFSKLGISGFFSYISFYIAIFTKLHLWSKMNVVYPKDDTDLINKIFFIGVGIGTLILIYSINKYKIKSFKKCLQVLSIFLVGILIGIGPWFGKNIYSTKNISISSLLSGKNDSFKVDYTKIYSDEEYEKIKEKAQLGKMTQSGTSTNEDFGRYFGYEKGINNYIKLPFNLTMQENQTGEYTDITYIFLALVPVILFLSFKTEIIGIGALLFTSLFFGLFYIEPINSFITNLFSQVTLPFGYIIIFLFFLIPFFYLMCSLKKDKNSTLFKLNLIFGMFYVFLWTISAFGIVWYGITMYFNFLFAFAVGIYNISSYKENDDFKIKFFKFFGSILTLFIILTYFFNSTFPHSFLNIKNSSYLDFKAGAYDNYTAIFEIHSDYYSPLVELNIKSDKQKDLVDFIISKSKNKDLTNILKENNISDLVILNQALKEINNIEVENNENANNMILLKREASKLRSSLYKNTLYPKDEYKNTAGIYRIGTFLRYFISDNYKRLLEDSLIFNFNNYFYDENDVNIGVERMKKVGINHFLVDLNAATIDKDPNHNLTKRYENLLKTFTSSNLELVYTDSVCLKVALEDYQKSQKTKEDLEKYMEVAGVNYESYTSAGEVVNRNLKMLKCYNHILEIMSEEGKINETDYNYLIPYANYITEKQISDEEGLLNFFKSYIDHGWFVLFKIK